MKHNWKKLLTLSAGAAVTAMTLTACSSGNTATTAAAATAPATTAETTVAASEETSKETSGETASADAAVTQEKPLVVYLNDFDAVIPDMFKEATGYEVEVVVGNGAETMSRIAAEKSNPQWDVVWIDSMYDVYNLSKDGDLMTDIEVENADNLTEFASALVPENKCFYPTGIHAAGVLVYRNDVYTEEEAPKTFEELADEKYAGKVGMADPAVAAPAYPLAA